MSRDSDLLGTADRLDVIIHLLTAIVTKGMARKEAVLTLSSAGLQARQIAEMLGLTGNQVSVVLYDARQTAAKATPASKATKRTKPAKDG
jgi:tRNA pseudouridine-54 N-methylase